MKKEKIKYFLLSTALILLLSLFFFKAKPVQAGYEHNVYQWIWSENIGWFSLNMVTSLGPQGDIDPRDYGLNIDYENRTIEGIAWSNHTGWVCFGQTCKNFDWQGAINDLGYGISPGSWCWNPPGNQTEPDIQYEESVENVRKVTNGWARIINLAIYGKAMFGSDDWGWVSLTWKNINTGPQYWVQVDLISRLLEGWAWSGTDGNRNQGQGGYGWIAFRYAPENVDTGTISGRVTDAETRDAIQGIKIYAYVYQGETNSNGDYTLSGVKYATYTITAFDPSGKYSPFSKPVTLDGPTKTVDFSLYKAVPEECYEEISGFVFYDKNNNNEFDGDDVKYDGAYVLIPGANYLQTTLSSGSYKCPVVAGGRCACTGLDYTIYAWYTDGTLQLSGAISVKAPITNANVPLKKGVAPQITGPWLQTWWSDVRAEKAIDVSANPAPGYANATYLITASQTINRFTSYGKELGWRKAAYPSLNQPLGFPTEASVFSPLDIDKLIATADYQFHDISKSADDSDFGDKSGVWYFYDTDDDGKTALTITGGEFGKKAKTIIVDGDLVFSGDTLYSSDLFSPEDLSSVGFIVRGNVIVDSKVKNIVGAFYVDKDKNDYGPPIAGKITIESTGNKETEKQFVCEGLMVAREFEFKRIIRDSDPERDPGYGWDARGSGGLLLRHYAPGEAPSEVIWYDSRVAVNTPKGFEDFAKALPKWEEK